MCTLLTAIFPGDRPACVNSKGLIVNDEPAAALLTSAFKQMDLIVLVEDISDSTELFNVSAWIGKERVAKLDFATREGACSLLSLSERQFREIQCTGATQALLVTIDFLSSGLVKHPYMKEWAC
jgi:hypothetical protein